MEIKRLIKAIIVFLLNFSFFALPFLLIILGSYEIIECRIFSLELCKFFINVYKLNFIILLLVFGILISLFSFLSNFFEERLKICFSIGYSCLLLLFLIYALNFGEFKIEIDNSQFLFNLLYGKITLSLSFKFIFYILVASILIDVIRKIILLIS